MPTKTGQRRGRGAAPVPATVDQQRKAGRSLRQKCPRGSHAAWTSPANRPSPLQLLDQSNSGRIAALIPIRYASAYADQSERDHAVLKTAARSGQVEVVMEADR